jgi:predicted DNA-binding transcriptional regulator AlpA
MTLETTNKPFGTLPQTGFVRKKAVLEVLGISSTTFWRLQRAGKFPKPDTRFGERTPVWRSEDVRAWIASGAVPRAAGRGLGAPTPADENAG